MESTPRMRASDQDRNEAVLALGEHHAAGRITLPEFTARMERALACTHLDELDPLFADLPALRSTAVFPAAPVSVRRGGPPLVALLVVPVLVVPLLVVFTLAAGSGHVFPLWLPILLFWMMGGPRRHWRMQRATSGAAERPSLTPRTARSGGAARPGERAPTSSSGPPGA